MLQSNIVVLSKNDEATASEVAESESVNASNNDAAESQGSRQRFGEKDAEVKEKKQGSRKSVLDQKNEREDQNRGIIGGSSAPVISTTGGS